MAEDRPSNRLGYNRARPGDPFPNDRERANKARQAAEALFAPKPRAVEAPIAPARKAADNRVSEAPRPTNPAVSRSARPVTRKTGAVLPATHDSNDASPARKIPAAHIAQIRTWLRYGMKIAEVAQVYGVEIEEIERALAKP